MIPLTDMWHHRSLTGVLAQEISHVIQSIRLSTGTCGTRDMAPERYHRIDDMIYMEKEIAHVIAYPSFSTGTCGIRDMAPDIYHIIDDTL
jgi:hypothetical protein